MKSKGDPILDLQEICKDNPVSKDALEKAYKDLGWGIPFESILSAATGVYIVQLEDGLYHPRNGNTKEIIAKTLGEKQ